ncbi:hypothetical protein T4B_10707, partial [Trichinella pseudospiralis]
MFACALESLLLGEGKNLLTVNISGYIAQCVASVEEHRIVLRSISSSFELQSQPSSNEALEYSPI